MAVSLPVGAETTLGTVSGPASVTLSRTVTPNAISAPPLNSLDSRTTVLVRIYATRDGSTFYQVLAGTEPGGVPSDADGITVTSSAWSVSAGPGEAQMKVTATPVSSAAISHVGVQAAIA